MSSSGSGEARPQRIQRSAPAEQHLGDRLAAFVDGELTDDTRDRVLAHLATCSQCKAAAAEQRRLKAVVAESRLPAISAGLLARLQGLPGMGAEGPGDGFPGGPEDFPGAPVDGFPGGPGPLGTDGPGGGPFEGGFEGGLLGSGSGMFGARRREDFSFLGPAPDLTAPAGSRSRGFRIHQAIRSTPPAPAAPAGGPAAASASRGRRFAFAAAGAFSLAAIAIGGALPMEAAVDGGARPDDGPAVSPLTADTSSVSDTRGVTPRGTLDAEDRKGRHAPLVAASGPSSAPAAPAPTHSTAVLVAAASPSPGATSHPASSVSTAAVASALASALAVAPVRPLPAVHPRSMAASATATSQSAAAAH